MTYKTFTFITDGLGQQSRHERLINVTSPVYSKTNVQQHDTSSPTRKMINKAASKVEQLPTLDRNNNNKYTDRNKLILKVQDLKSMHQQLIKENKSHDTGNTKENGLLQHIEKQIQLRKMQKQRYRGAYKQLSPKTKKPRQTSYQIIRPKRMFAAAPSNIGQVKSNSPHNSFPQNKIQQPMKQNTVLTQQQLYQSHPKMSNVNNDVLQVQKLHQPFIGSTKASANDVAYLKNFIKQIKPSSSVNVMTKDARSRHILVPLSALTSGQVLNNRMVLSNPYAIPLNKIIRLVPNEVSFKETPKGIQTSTPLPSTSSSTVKATTSSPTSTVKKITTSLTTPPSTR